MLASDIKGFLVYSKDMVSLGKVKDVEFDPSEMKVTNIVVDFEKEAAKEVLGKRIGSNEVRRVLGKFSPFSGIAAFYLMYYLFWMQKPVN